MASALIGAYIIIFDATSLCYTSLYVLHIAIYVLIHIMLLGRFGLIYNTGNIRTYACRDGLEMVLPFQQRVISGTLV